MADIKDTKGTKGTEPEKEIGRLPAGFASMFHGGSEDGEMTIARRSVKHKPDQDDRRASYWQNPRPEWKPDE